MINAILNLIAPHHCLGCQKTGTVLCDNCKYNIINEPFSQCLVCLTPTSRGAICQQHKNDFATAWCVGVRDEILEQLIDEYKFRNNKDALLCAGDLLASTLDTVDVHTIYVPVPTIHQHIRQRGYDHTAYIARAVQKKHGGSVAAIVTRRRNFTQRGASRKKRLEQSKISYEISPQITLSKTVQYVIVDDVYTTGATAYAVREALRVGGARQISIAIVTRQLLDESL